MVARESGVGEQGSGSRDRANRGIGEAGMQEAESSPAEYALIFNNPGPDLLYRKWIQAYG